MKPARFHILIAAVLGIAACASAPTYPAKPVKVLVPYTAGSATDVIARLVSTKLSGLWGQPVVIENRPGAGGSTAAGEVAKAKPDGYTLLLHSSSYSVNQALYANLPYSMKDFIDVAPLAKQPFALVVSPDAGFKNVGDPVSAAQKNPGQIKLGSAGTGSATHLVAEKFKSGTGIDAVHVPFKGGLEANNATVSGEVTYWFPPTAISLKGVKDGKLQALAVTSSTRFALLPDAPTIAEAAIAGFEDGVWWGIWVPAGVSAEIADKLAKDIARALAAPDLREPLAKSGYEPMSMSSAEFSRLVRSELESAARTIKAAGIKTP